MGPGRNSEMPTMISPEIFREQAGHEVCHAFALQLKDALGIAGGDHVVDFFIRQIHMVDIHLYPRPAFIMASVSRMTVSVRRPRKSILSRPRSLILFMWYWVVMLSSFFLLSARGAYSVTGSPVITTAAACVPLWRAYLDLHGHIQPFMHLVVVLILRPQLIRLV